MLNATLKYEIFTILLVGPGDFILSPVSDDIRFSIREVKVACLSLALQAGKEQRRAAYGLATAILRLNSNTLVLPRNSQGKIPRLNVRILFRQAIIGGFHSMMLGILIKGSIAAGVRHRARRRSDQVCMPDGNRWIALAIKSCRRVKKLIEIIPGKVEVGRKSIFQSLKLVVDISTIIFNRDLPASLFSIVLRRLLSIRAFLNCEMSRLGFQVDRNLVI